MPEMFQIQHPFNNCTSGVRSLFVASIFVVNGAAGHAQASGNQPSGNSQSRTEPTSTVLNLPAGPLADSLKALSSQTGVRLAVDARWVANKQAPFVNGPHTAAQALTLLLAGSGMGFSEGADGLFTLRPSGAAAAELPQIVVTGTKRAQARQQATQSVSVLTEQDTIGLQSGFDVFSRLPNVTWLSDSFLPTVRGLDGNGVAAGGGGAVTGANPRMSNYVDGVARTFAATPDGQGSFWDMGQIEVYRGAQSTQLGQNSIAGAIVQTTQDPQFKDALAVQFGAHDQRATYNAAVMVNKALGDRLAVRFTAETSNGKNAIDYSGFTGTGLTPSDRDELGRLRFDRFRFKALFTPSDKLGLKLTVEQERRRNPYTPDGASISNRRELTDGQYGSFDSKNEIVALNANYAIAPEWVFDAVLSQQKATTQFGPPVVGNPDRSTFLDFSFRSNEVAFEPKLVYKAKGGRTGAVFGAYAKQRERSDLGKPGSAFELNADDRAHSRSVFADATVQIAPNWDVLAAARYQDDRQTRNFSAADGLLAYGFDERNKVFLPKLGATYHLSADASVSVVAYEGYNGGGGGVSFISLTPYRYDKETASTFEIVSRTQWLDRQLTVNANLFYTQLKGAQNSSIGPGGPNDAVYGNIAKARTQGLEFDLTYQPNARSKVQFALGLLDAKLIDFGSAANNFNNGNQLALSPRVTANLSGSFEALPRLTLGGDVAYVSKRFNDLENTPQDQLPGYMVANLNARWRVGGVTFTGYINNVFDRYVAFTRSTAINIGNVNDPRTLGVNARFDY